MIGSLCENLHIETGFGFPHSGGFSVKIMCLQVDNIMRKKLSFESLKNQTGKSKFRLRSTNDNIETRKHGNEILW